MSANRELDRIVRSWLREDGREDADRVLDLVLDQLDTTPQRRAGWLARRFPFMSGNRIRFGIAVAAVLAAGVLGYQFLPGPGTGVRLPSPTPTASPSPTPTATPTPTLAPVPAGAVAAGSYLINDFTIVPFTLTLPDGWTKEDNFIGKGDVWEGDGVTFASWFVTHIYADSCDWEGALVDARTVAQQVAALSEQVGHETQGPVDVTLGGQPAARFTFSLPAEFDVNACDNAFVRLWPDAGPNENFGLPIFPGQTTTVYVVDPGRSDELPQLIVGIVQRDSPPDDIAELESIIASIDFAD